MTKDEALKFALEALEGADMIDCDMRDAITAIKEALALQEHDYKDLYEKEKRKSAMWLAKYEEVAGPAPTAIPMAQPEQDGKCKYCTDGCLACDARKLPERERFLVATIGNWGRVEWADGVFPSLGDKMYSAPRTWVGLTDEDLYEIYNKANWDVRQSWDYERAIEAKLKEKNT